MKIVTCFDIFDRRFFSIFLLPFTYIFIDSADVLRVGLCKKIAVADGRRAHFDTMLNEFGVGAATNNRLS